ETSPFWPIAPLSKTRALSPLSSSMNKISSRALDQWNQGRGPFFQIRECDLKWNFSSQNWISYEDVELNGVPAVVAMVAGEGARQGVPAQTLWISLWGTIQEGSESRFLEEAL